jgi:glyoxylase-like metal-dependent hydrolase (beta-lactamase superfamily II)
VRELRAGLWHWQAPHPEWSHDQWWPQLVSSYAFDDGSRLLLFDPLAVPEEILALAPGREPAIVLTAPWHERDAQSLVERLGAPVYTPPPDTADDLIRKYGLDPAQIPEGWHSDDVDWLVVEGRGESHVFLAGDRLPIGVEVLPGRSHNDVVLWIERAGAIVTGDSLVDFNRGFEVPQEVIQHGSTREQVVADLRPLLELPVELVLPAHGEPTDRAALEQALS